MADKIMMGKNHKMSQEVTPVFPVKEGKKNKKSDSRKTGQK